MGDYVVLVRSHVASNHPGVLRGDIALAGYLEHVHAPTVKRAATEALLAAWGENQSMTMWLRSGIAEPEAKLKG